MIGSALGDAVGQLQEGPLNQAVLATTLGLIETLPYTADTAMAIALAESLISHPTFNAQAFGDALARTYQHAPWRGYTIALPMIFALVADQGLSYQQAAIQVHGHSRLDLAAVTRITPLALAYAAAPDLYVQAASAASVTHVHPVALDGAAVFAKAIALLLPLSPATPFVWQPWLADLIAFAQTRTLRQQLQSAAALFADHVAPRVAFDYLGSGEDVHHVLPFALYAFMAQPTCYECSLIEALAYGGERHALGALTGALAGAYLGLDAIPAPWQPKVENARYILRLAATLAEKAGVAPTLAALAAAQGRWN